MRKFPITNLGQGTIQVDIKSVALRITPARDTAKIELVQYVVDEYLNVHGPATLSLDEVEDVIYNWLQTSDAEFEPMELGITSIELFEFIRVRCEAVLSRREIDEQREYRREFRKLRQQGHSSREARRRLEGGEKTVGSGPFRNTIVYGKPTRGRTFSIDPSKITYFAVEEIKGGK